jgi:uncharacterized protein (DUF2062 family)
MKKTVHKIKAFFASFFDLEDSAHNIAAGAALGIFFGIMPVEGITTTLVFVTLLGFNKPSALLGMLATNSWTTFVLLPLAALAGGLLFNKTIASLYVQFDQTYQMGLSAFFSKASLLDLALPLVVGYLIVALTIALLFYLIIYVCLKYFKVEK